MSLQIRSDLHVLACDTPGCPEFVEGCGSTPSAQRKFAVAAAELAGWQLSPHEDVPVDRCAKHHDIERPTMRVTRLYDEHGKALPYTRRA